MTHERLGAKTCLRRAVAWSALVFALGFGGLRPSMAADERQISLAELTGRKISLVLKTGKTIDDAEVTKVTAAPKPPGAVKSLTVKAQGKVQTVSAATIGEIYQAGEPLDVVFDKRSASLAHSPEKRSQRLAHQAEVAARLGSLGERFWPDVSEEQQAAQVEQWKTQMTADLKQAQTPPTVLHETKYYLFYTDLPQEQISGYIAQLDAMYADLCNAFNIPVGKNIWLGKCIVVCFADQANFLKVEQTMFKGEDIAGVAGLCHQRSDGRVVVCCHRGNDPVHFAKMLVHETSHGFLHRYRTSVHIPKWINEGVADWVAGNVVKSDRSVVQRQAEAAEHCRQFGSLGDEFFAVKKLTPWHYGAASSLVEVMLRIDARKYKAFIDLIKEGNEWPDALEKSYGLSRAELVQHYGVAIGVPNLRP